MNPAKKGLFVRLQAKAGLEAELSTFLEGALPLANAELATNHWFAIQFDAKTFGIFDTFSNDDGRNSHLNGPIAAALMANAVRLLSEAPTIEKIDVLAAK